MQKNVNIYIFCLFISYLFLFSVLCVFIFHTPPNIILWPSTELGSFILILGGSILGVKFLDPLAGLLVSGMILKAGIETGYQRSDFCPRLSPPYITLFRLPKSIWLLKMLQVLVPTNMDVVTKILLKISEVQIHTFLSLLIVAQRTRGSVVLKGWGAEAY